MDIHFNPILNCSTDKCIPGADPGVFKRVGGSILGLQAKKGGFRRGSNFGPNVKKPTSWHKKGGPDPLDPPPPRSRV